MKHAWLCLGKCFLGIVAVVILLGCGPLLPISISSGSEPTPTNAVDPGIPTVIARKSPPTLTPSPPMTSVVTPRLYTIDITSGGEAPSDLQDYMFGYPGIGGGGGPEDCSEVLNTLTWVRRYANETQPGIPQRLMWIVDALALPPDLSSTLTLPDGSIVQPGVDIESYNYCSYITYEIMPGSLLGTYTVEIVQGNTSLKDSVTLSLPTDPLHMTYQGIEWFEGFEPNERVTLWMYYWGYLSEFQKAEIALLFPELPDYGEIFTADDLNYYSMYAFLGQQIVIADEYGTFQVQYTSEQLNGLIDLSEIDTVAQGETSGYAQVDGLGESCSGSLPTRLEIGAVAQVTGYGNPVIGRSGVNLNQGTHVTVVLGPFCRLIYGLGWEWIVDTPEQARIIVRECDAEGYFLEPVNP